MTNKNRVIGYIDGLNVYGGLKNPPYRKYLWLDLPKLIELFLGSYEELVVVKYFYSPMLGNIAKEERQSVYLDALSSDPRVELFPGKFKVHNLECRNCGHIRPDRREKETDTGMASEIVKDAFIDAYDMAVILSGDTDFVPPARIVRTHHADEGIYLLKPFNCGPCDDLQTQSTKFSKIGQRHLSQCQFDEEVISSEGFTIQRPSHSVRYTKRT